MSVGMKGGLAARETQDISYLNRNLLELLYGQSEFVQQVFKRSPTEQN